MYLRILFLKFCSNLFISIKQPIFLFYQILTSGIIYNRFCTTFNLLFIFLTQYDLIHFISNSLRKTSFFHLFILCFCFIAFLFFLQLFSLVSYYSSEPQFISRFSILFFRTSVISSTFYCRRFANRIYVSSYVNLSFNEFSHFSKYTSRFALPPTILPRKIFKEAKVALTHFCALGPRKFNAHKRKIAVVHRRADIAASVNIYNARGTPETQASAGPRSFVRSTPDP